MALCLALIGVMVVGQGCMIGYGYTGYMNYPSPSYYPSSYYNYNHHGHHNYYGGYWYGYPCR